MNPNFAAGTQLDAERFGVRYLVHATLLVELDGVRILTDPVLRRRTVHLRPPEIEAPEQYV